jgi:hypothetical protein
MEERSSLFKQKGKKERDRHICSLSAQEAPVPPVRVCGSGSN